jgi:hypothetical protein
LNEAGDSEFTLRANRDLYEFLAPWSGMLVLVDDFAEVLWCGVPVRRRGEIGSGELVVQAREWIHWLGRVSPLIFDSTSAPFDDYGDYEGVSGVKAGAIVADLMARIPQSRPGIVQCPLLPPSSSSGAVVSLGDLQLDVGRPYVWDMLSPLRDRGVEFWVRTRREGRRYVPRVIVGDPNLGSPDPVPLWIGGNVSGAELEEDGDQLVTRWRVKGSAEGVEVFAADSGLGAGQLLLDNVKDYGDRFVDASDELSELTTRAQRMLEGTSAVTRWFTGIEMSGVVRLEPGDAVLVSSPVVRGDPRLVEEFEVEARVESVTYETGVTTLTLAQPDYAEAPLQPRRSMARWMRDMSSRVSSLGMR